MTDTGPLPPVLVPMVAGQADFEVLRAVNRWLPATFEEHIAWLEEAGARLAEAGTQVDLVPVWAPLYLLWCDEQGVDPGGPEALAAWASRTSVPYLSYTAYEYGPLVPLAEMEAVRSAAIASIVCRPETHSCAAVLHRWAAATALLADMCRRTGPRSELDVFAQTSPEPLHWHLDGSTCEMCADTEDHVHCALLYAMGTGGWAVVTERDEVGGAVVRVWKLGGAEGVVPLCAAEAAAVCHPEPGTMVATAWGLPAEAA